MRRGNDVPAAMRMTCLEDERMDDLIWLAIIVGLMAATLAYVRVADNA